MQLFYDVKWIKNSSNVVNSVKSSLFFVLCPLCRLPVINHRLRIGLESNFVTDIFTTNTHYVA